MRQEVTNRMQTLLREKSASGWLDGWVYGRLKQEFALQPDELNAIASALGFKYGWNAAVEDVLEAQWQKEEKFWMEQELVKAEANLSHTQKKAEVASKIDLTRRMTSLLQALEASGEVRQEMTDLEKVLIRLMLRMKTDEQLWLLEKICNRPRSGL